MSLKTISSFAVVAVSVCGCLATPTSREYSEKLAKDRARWDAEIASYPAETYSTSGMRQRYSGATYLDFNVQHGTQVEYLAPDGRAFLWYPGNTTVVVGQWTVMPPASGSNYARLCWKYGPQTFNPATGSVGGDLHCVSANRQILAEEEYTRGDPFGLASRGIPFPLNKKKQYSMIDLAARAGVTVELQH